MDYRSPDLITLTTDFGLDDPYVGVMKGVIYGINPAVRVVDLCHGIGPQDVRAAAFVLKTNFSYFPPGTIHVAVVDPGVGSERAIVAVRTASYLFVAPDNGLLAPLLADQPALEAVALQNPDYRLPDVSRTFHGRDIIAPAAAHLARGISLARLGPPIELKGLDWPVPQPEANGLRACVLYVDRFGNAITNLQEPLWRERVGTAPFKLVAGRGRWTELASAYAEVPAGRSLALFGSSGYLELSISGGNAAEYLALAPDTEVVLTISEQGPDV